jgi:hypothetical protein
MIKYGDIEYFTLLDLRDKLKYFQYDKLDLFNLDRLRSEVEIKIEAIHLENKKSLGVTNY